MKFRNCQTPHYPPHSYGDCVRACLATVIDRDDVPHTFDGRPVMKAWQDLAKYLKKHGKFIVRYAPEDPYLFMKEKFPNTPYVLLGSTVEGNHAVVCKDDKIIHNPSVEPSELIGATKEGFYIVMIVKDYR